MNVPVHLSDQISGQLCNQVGTQLPGLSQPNINAVHSQVPAMGGQHEMNHEVLKARRYMIQKIYSYLILRQPQGQEIHQRRIADLAKQFEAFLFQSAVTMEEYVNLDTLEHRLCRFSRNHRHQFPQPVNSIGKMIPTTGMSHHVSSNLNVTSSMDTSRVAASICNTVTSTNADGGNILSTGNGSSMIHGGSYSSFVGKFSNGYQQSPSKVSISSGNNIFSSLGVQRIGSQMMPGFVNSKNNNQSYMNMSASNTGGFSTVNSTMFSETQQQKQQASGQSSHILCNLGRQIGGGISSAQKPYAFSNGSLNGEVGMVGGNSKLVNVSGTSEGSFTGTHYVNSSKSLPQHFDQLEGSSMEGDIYRMGFSNPSGAGNFGGPVLSVGSVMNLKGLNAVNLHGMSKAGSRLIADELNLQNKQHSANVKPQSMDLSEKMNCSSQLSPKENFLQSYQQKQLLQQQHPHEFQEQQQFVPHISQQKQHNLFINDTFGKLPLASDLGNKDVETRNEVLQQLQLSQLQNQLQQKSTEEHIVGAQMQSLSTNQLSTYSSSCQISQPMQQYLHPHQFVTEPQNGSSSVTVQSETGMQEQWSPLSQNISVMSNEQHLQEVSRHRTMGQYGTGRDEFSSKGSIIGESIASKGTVGIPIASGDALRSTSINRKLQFLNQQRWLLFMLHARRCVEPEGKCLEPHCIDVQRLWRHIESCKLSLCSTPRCRLSRSLFSHYKHCCHPGCPVCVPVKKFVHRHYRVNTDSGLVLSTSVTCTSNNTEEHLARILASKSCPSIVETSNDLQPSAKRLKTEPHFHSLIPKVESSTVSVPVIHETHVSQNLLSEEKLQLSRHGSLKSEFTNDTVKIPLSIGQLSPNSSKMKDKNSDLNAQRIDDESACFANQEMVVHEKETDQVKRENVAVAAEPAKGIMCGKPKIKGVSLIEFFTPEQIHQHIRGLRQWIGQSKTKAEKNQAMEQSMSESCCQLCAVEKLYFEPPPIYCARCGVRIKQNAMYYTMGTGDSRHYFCIHCYSKSPGDAILADGAAVPKANLQKMKNDKQTEEGWVQCDKCEAWQHQICTLFNSRRNDGGQAEYTCPNCCIAEVERGERKPLPENAVLGAKDLPKTLLSDHIEERLFKGLKQERLERARIQGKTYDEVPGAEALVVRVVSSVDKKLEVKQRFLEMFQEENYPTEFPYKSKVILLFQKIEGVEVCLFGMYVQEFGSECRFPNQRRVYLSYLDSVKYFRPEIKAVSGEALRTFVYHEILIGYLDYCKKRGFTSCYIWACPPLKGEDYILYCHPEIQKTPKSEKLREWYLSMLKKAAKENIAVDLTNMYDHFFISKGDCKAKVTAARLPYFDGDYWPGTAEDMINELQQEEEGRKLNKKVTTKKTVSKRALKASGQTDMYGNASKDLLLMHRLGATISPMKEDFIMVHLQHACTHCCRLMVSGNRWTCDQCKKFQLCDSCYATEQKLEERERHPTNQKDKHVLYKVEINNVPVDTKDKDEILESEFFDTRQAFLSLCQGNHYQYDTLRRAKHSSMMILYHLHNPTAPAFVTTCYKCHLDIETGQGWHCETCPDYDVCNACYQKDGGIDHPHTLTNHPSVVDGDVQNKEARQLRVLQHRKMLDLLVHASQCPSPQCQYPNCRKVKGLFRHGIQCRRRASGGCVLCKKMWYLLKLHARACKNPECQVPRCRDLREHMRRLQHQSDSRRRAAVKEMMRQRAAEVASNSG